MPGIRADLPVRRKRAWKDTGPRFPGALDTPPRVAYSSGNFPHLNEGGFRRKS